MWLVEEIQKVRGADSQIIKVTHARARTHTHTHTEREREREREREDVSHLDLGDELLHPCRLTDTHTERHRETVTQ